MFHRLSVARLLCFPTLIFGGGSPRNLLVMCSSSSRGSGTCMVVNARNQSSPPRPSSHCHPKPGTPILSLRRRQIEPLRASAACRRAQSCQNRSSSSHLTSSKKKLRDIPLTRNLYCFRNSIPWSHGYVSSPSPPQNQERIFFDVAGEDDRKISFGQLKRFSLREVQLATEIACANQKTSQRDSIKKLKALVIMYQTKLTVTQNKRLCLLSSSSVTSEKPEMTKISQVFLVFLAISIKQETHL
ncbi:hypothetical protein Bca4012_063912 [Brassica carinata]